MSQRWFTADFHLSMTDILKFEKRPFANIIEHDNALLLACNQKANAEDIIIHIGDLYSFGQDRGSPGGEEKPADIVKQISATFVNIRGNHDLNNKVKSVCDSMRTSLGKLLPNVSVSHYPSYHPKAFGNFRNGDVHLCGHVHRRWKHCLDLDHQVLNINCGVDVWDYSIVSEDELITYIIRVLKLPSEQLTKAKKVEGRLKYV